MTTAVILGDLIEYSWKNDVFRAAEILGWDVVTFDPTKPVTTDTIFNTCWMHLADLFIWPRWGQSVEGDVEVLYHNLNQIGTKSVAIHQDLYWDRPERAEFWKDDWFKADYVFTADGDPSRAWFAVDVNHYWMPPAIPDRFVGRGELKKEYDCDVVFVGSVQKVHGQWRKDLISFAQKRYGKRFEFYGLSTAGAVWGDELKNVYASAKVVLGDSVDVPWTWSDRIPNTLGRGGCLVHPDTLGLSETFGRGISYYERGNLGDVAFHIDRLLDDPASRAEQSDIGFFEVYRKHTWSARLDEIARTVLGETYDAKG